MKYPRNLAEAHAEIDRLRDEKAAMKRELENLYRELRFNTENINAAVRRVSWGNNGSG